MQIVNHNFKISIINITIGTQRRTMRPPRFAPALHCKQHMPECFSTPNHNSVGMLLSDFILKKTVSRVTVCSKLQYVLKVK